MPEIDNFWRDFIKKNGIYTAYWFDLDINEVALVSNNIYHKLASSRYRTVTLLVENVDNAKFAVIAIVSIRKLSRQEIIKSVLDIPHGKESMSVDGGI